MRISARCPSLLALLLPLNNTSTHRWESAAAIFWGIAATSYRGGHITVDLLWTHASPRYKRWIDVFATLVLLLVVTVQTIMLFDKVASTYRDNVQTYDLNLPTWPFFAVAWFGDVCAVLLIAIRTWRLIADPEALAPNNGQGH